MSVQLMEGTGYTLGASTRLDTKFRSGSYSVAGNPNSAFSTLADDIDNEWENCGETAIIQEAAGTHEVKVYTKNRVHRGPAFVGYDYSVVLLNMEATATRENDYTVQGTLDLDANDYLEPASFEINIVDSNQLEADEEFTMQLFINGLTDNIQVTGSCVSKRFRIIDDDTVNYTLGARTRTVTEGEDIEFVASVDGEHGQCISPVPVTTALRLVDGETSALSAPDAVTRIRVPPCTADATGTITTAATPGMQGTRELVFEGKREVLEGTKRRISVEGVITEKAYPSDPGFSRCSVWC